MLRIRRNRGRLCSHRIRQNRVRLDSHGRLDGGRPWPGEKHLCTRIRCQKMKDKQVSPDQPHAQDMDPNLSSPGEQRRPASQHKSLDMVGRSALPSQDGSELNDSSHYGKHAAPGSFSPRTGTATDGWTEVGPLPGIFSFHFLAMKITTQMRHTSNVKASVY